MGSMQVVVSDGARQLAVEQGSVVYVRSHEHRCCAGPVTLLDVTTEAPPDAGDFVPVDAAGLTVRYHGDPEKGPHVLTIDVRGRRRRRLVSYWDGCAYKV